MKSLLVITFLLSSIFLFAQRNFYVVTKGAFMSHYEYGWQYSQSVLNKEKYLKNNVEKIEVNKYSKKSKHQNFEYYNEKGLLIKMENFYNGKKYTNEFTYDKNDNIILLKSIDWKGKVSQTKYTYDEANRMLTSERINSKGKYFGKKKTYNEEGKITSHLLFEKNRETPTKELYYSYYEDGSKKQTIYKVNGRVKYTWNFECSNEGEILSKDKKETKVCVLKEEDENGNIVTWKREFHKGKLTKTKTIKTKDGTWLSTERFNEKDELVSIRQRKETGGVLTFVRNKNGKMEKSSESFINTNGKITKYIRYDKKWGYTNIFHYNDDLLISYTHIGKRRIIVNEYNYFSRKS